MRRESPQGISPCGPFCVLGPRTAQGLCRRRAARPSGRRLRAHRAAGPPDGPVPMANGGGAGRARIAAAGPRKGALACLFAFGA